MKKFVLLTRPRAASVRWASLLATHGFDSLIEPLLVIEPTQTPRPTGMFQSTVITSAQALDALEDLKTNIADLLSLPCFCVGASTGEAARRFGFTDIHCGTADSEALAQEIIAVLPDKTQPLLHIAGDVVDDKAYALLAQAGFTLTPWVVYRARAAEDFTPATRNQFYAGTIAAIPVFSPRSARILVSLIEKNRLTQACHRITAIGLSQAVADVLQTLPWRALRVAALPTEEHILACLTLEPPMTQNIPTPPQTQAPAKCGGKKKCCFWIGVSIVVLASAVAVALTKCPWLYPAPVVTQAAAPDLTALEQRVAVLETRLNAVSPASVPTTAADTTTPDAVKNMQSQLAQIQTQSESTQQTTRKLIAASFAFLDLRDEARTSRPFTTALANLRANTSDSATITEQAAKLEPFASKPPLTLAQLRDDLKVQEATLPPPAETGAGGSVWDRLKSILHPLIAMHPLHNPQFVALENALDSDDAQVALAAFKLLPDDTQRKLADWQSKLEDRAAVDDALRALEASFTTTVPVVPTP